MNDEKQLNVFTIENDVLIKYVGEDENIVVPIEVKKINSYAFYNCRNIKSVQIPNSVVEIGKCAFMDCSRLQTITIPNNAKILGEPSVLGHIFSGCSALEKIETSIEKRTEIYRLIDVEKLFTQKGQSAFGLNEEYTHALKLDMLQCFDNPVKNKKKLLTAIIDIDDEEALQILLDKKYITNTKIRDELIEYAAKNKKTVTLAVLLEYKERTGDRKKEERQREKKERLLMNAPVDLKKLWTKELYPAFKKVKKSEQYYGIKGYQGDEHVVEVPDSFDNVPVRQINAKAFASYKRSSQSRADALNAITEIILPDTIQNIGSEAFHGCESLKNIVIPESVKWIGDAAFMRCSSLEEIMIPDHIELGKMAFKYCESLKNISLPKSRSIIEASDFAHCISLTNVVIPEHITEIGGWAFNGCSNLKQVTIHQNVNKIHKMAFNDCRNLTIHAPKGSYAEQYAKENNIPFVAE